MKRLLRLRFFPARLGADSWQRSVLLLLFVGGLLPLAQAQCPTGNVTLNTQAEVDAFPPGCTNMPGNLIIRGDNITDLRPLSALQSIGGHLYIYNNGQLSSLAGLNNLTTIGSFLSISNNDQLSSLTGLDKLASIRGFLYIGYNAQLNSLAGLDKITSIEGFLNIRNNSQLSSLAGLNNLVSIEDFLLITANDQLSSLDGLEKLNTIGGYLNINGNVRLNSLAGLNDLTSIGGNLIIVFNARLSQCAIPPICQYLTNPKGTIEIANNAPDCNSMAEVQADCQSLSITTQPPSGSIVCTGASVTASVVTTGNVRAYQWYRSGQALDGQTSATLSLNNVQATDQGSYLAVVSNSVTSLTSAAFNLTVQQPSVSISPSTTAICQGQRASFTASGAYAYQWRGPESFTSQASTISVSAPGTYSVTGTTTAGCSASATASLTVNPKPSVSLNSNGTLTCANTSVTLRAEPAGQGTYAFTGPGLSQTSTANSAMATRPGTYSVVLTIAGGCSATATAEVSQNIAPPTGVSLSSSGTLSANNPTVTLTATSNATANVGVSYAFSPPAQKQGDNRATVTTSGIYSVTATRADNGCSAIAITTVLGAASTTACRGTSTTITLTPAGNPSRYEWYIGVAVGQPLRDGAYYQGTTTASLRVVSVSQSQIYYAKVFYADGSSVVYGPYRVTMLTNCGAREAATVEPGESTRANELRITLLGNPLQGEALRAVVTGATGQSLSVQLLDVKGQSVRSQVVESAESAQAVEWDVTGWPSGLYLLQAVSGKQYHNVKVVKP